MSSLQGQLLIAPPSMKDPNFARTVTLLIQHDEEGALGLVLNHPTEIPLAEAWKQVSESPCRRTDQLYLGGPCEGPLMTLHNVALVGEKEVLPGVYFTADHDEIGWLVEHHAGQFKAIVGYAGWSPGQLEDELAIGSWLIAKAEPDDLFESADAIWGKQLAKVNGSAEEPYINPRIIPDDPTNN